MCGIAGSLGRPELLERLLRGIAHRGPDASGRTGRGPLAIGCARLRINGGPADDMPVFSRSRRTAVVANAEIFNHRELFGEFPAGEDRSDLRGLADLIEREGPKAFSRIRGPFAIAAADFESQSLLLARDEFGVRPLYLHEGDGAIAFASEIGPLAGLSPSPAPDPECWAHAMAFQFWPAGGTPWKQVSSLPPGSWRRHSLAGTTLEVRSGRFANESGSGALADELPRSFALQARRAPDTAVLLSGGLDSSAVAAMLTRAGAPPAVAAVGWFPDAPAAYDERPHARAVAKELGLELVEIAIDPARWHQGWRRAAAALAGPLAGPGAASEWVLAEELSRRGVRVAYSGQGGDELYGGYERHRILQQIDAGGDVEPAPGYERLRPPPGVDPVRHLVFRGAELLPWLSPAAKAAVLEAARALPSATPRARALLDWEIRTFLPGLLTVTDHALAAFGIEGRVPLLDPVVARLVRPFPLEVASPAASPRGLFRRMFGAQLPAAAAARKDKMGFPVPLDEWLRGPLRDVVMEIASSRFLGVLGLEDGVRSAIAGYRLGLRTMWFLGSAVFALERYLDAGAPSPIWTERQAAKLEAGGSPRVAALRSEGP